VVQVDPIKPTLKLENAWNWALETKACIMLSNVAFNFNLRRYMVAENLGEDMAEDDGFGN
jgi:hypothetical protein